MDETRETLLLRLKSGGDDPSWGEFDALYRPFLIGWYRRKGLQHEDAEDLAQQALLRARAGLPGFTRERSGSFRGWLGAIARNVQVTWARKRRPGGLTPADEDALVGAADGWRPEWDREHDAYLVALLLKRVRGDFEPATFRAFELLVLGERPVDEVAAACGLEPASVYQAKSRVLRRLREAAGGFLE